MIQKSTQESNKKDKFDTTVKYPGMNVATSSHSQKGFSKHQSPPSEMSFNPFNGQVSAKKEKQIELTHQILSLQNQGYIKSVPKGEVTTSIDGPLNELPSRDSPSFVHSQVKKSSRMHDDQIRTQSNFDVKQFDVTNAFSQSLDSLEHTEKTQKEARSLQATDPKFDSSLRAQKEFLIRSNKAPAYSHTGTASHNMKNSVKFEDNIDLEDTLIIDTADERNTWNSHQNNFHSGHNPHKTLSNLWDGVLKDLEKKDIERAYEKVMSSGIGSSYLFVNF